MKQTLQLKMGQSLTMTPQLQQAIRLLQLSTLDLQNEIQEALDSNPMLEVEDVKPEPEAKKDPQTKEEKKEKEAEQAQDAEGDWNQDIPEDLPVDTSWDDVYQSAPSGPAPSGDDEFSFESRNSVSETLHDHLMWQLNLTNFSDKDYAIAVTLLDSVEASGLLSSSIDDLYEGLNDAIEDVDLDEVYAVLHRLQQFDPPGVVTQDINECLLVQLNQLPKDTPFLCTARDIIRDYLPLLGTKDYKTIMRKLNIKETELKHAISLIQTLNPRPGDDIGSDNTEYVVPDVFVSKKNQRWTVELNPDIAPKLRINSSYASMVKRADSSSDNTYLKDNLQEAKWFLKSLQSRNETLLKVATCIVEKQQGFLDFGEEAMKPLVLFDVAEAVEMHESTISRVTTQKYMHTPKGIFELKYFFSSHVSTDSGGECSSTAIRAIIKKLIAAENVQKPLSDSKIANLLAEQGIKVARRTIAKYRESMSIPPSNERKQLA